MQTAHEDVSIDDVTLAAAVEAQDPRSQRGLFKEKRLGTCQMAEGKDAAERETRVGGPGWKPVRPRVGYLASLRLSCSPTRFG